MKQVPTDFRRVTMMARHMEPALQIYRDILGMEVHYDQEIDVTGTGVPTGVSGARARLVILKCNDPYIGMLGIMHYLEPALPDPPPRPVPNRVQAGEIVFVMNNDNVEVAYQKLKNVEGVEVVADPHVSEFTGKDGATLHVMGISFFDPNGYFVDLNQIVE